MQFHQQSPQPATPFPTSDLVGSQQGVLASLDVVLGAYRAAGSRQDLRSALLGLFATASAHFANLDDARPFRRTGAEGAALLRGHQSLLRYIEHAALRVEHWESSQVIVCLRFLDHALTTQLNDEIFHVTWPRASAGISDAEDIWNSARETTVGAYHS